MKEDKFETAKVNPPWFKQNLVTLFNKIYDLINEKENPSDEELLIQAWIEWEWYRYKKDWFLK